MRPSPWLLRAADKIKDVIEEEIPKEVPKPYTVPPGWVPPTLGEQFRYAAQRHPYYRYGYAAAILVGLMGWGIATEEKKAHPEKFGHTPGKAPRAAAEE